MQPYSVLMSVYRKEQPEYLRQSVASICAQTVPTDDFVLVCDGPLTPELDDVIADMQARLGAVLHVVRLPQNGGLGAALNVGIQHCRHELVARMDSDDISRPDRCARQLAAFAAHPEVSILSGWVEEFTDTPEHITSRREVPEDDAAIRRFARRRNPFNHPCVMYRKSAVQAAGGYQPFFLLEDYYLWVRMLQHHAVGYNIQAPLLWMRGGSNMYKRRSGGGYCVSQVRLLQYMMHTGFITGREFCMLASIRVGASLLPNSVRMLLFQKLLRRQTV